MNRKGLLIVVSGPAGVGKGTICKAYLKKHEDIVFSVSTTTRQPREGERDGVEYNFTTKENFQKMIQNNELLEYVNVFDNFYGTSRIWVEEQIQKGNDVLLEIEIVGAMNIKKIYKDALLIFILPPSFDILENRIRTRNQDSDEQIRKRLSRAVEEVHMIKDYDYYIVNDTIEESVDLMRAIIVSQRQNVSRYGDNQVESFLKDIEN